MSELINKSTDDEIESYTSYSFPSRLNKIDAIISAAKDGTIEDIREAYRGFDEYHKDWLHELDARKEKAHKAYNKRKGISG